MPGSYRLIFVVFNTLFNLLTQDDQVRCFENVAAHLTDDGAFVVEAFVPAFLYRLRDDQYVDAEAIGVDEVRLDVLRHDPVTQMLDESHVSLSRGGRAPEPDRHALRLAERARSHGAHRRAAPAGPLGRLAAESPSPPPAARTSPSTAAEPRSGWSTNGTSQCSGMRRVAAQRAGEPLCYAARRPL